MNARLIASLTLLLSAACSGSVIQDDGIGGDGGSGANGSVGPGTSGSGKGSVGAGPGTSGSGQNGTGTSGAGGATQTEFEAYCDKRAAACGTSSAECKAYAVCALDLLRDSIESNFLGCLASQCDDGDQCLSAIVNTPVSDVGAKFNALCDANDSNCGGGDDICILGYLLSDATLKPFLDCYALSSCTGIEQCLDQNLEVINKCDGWL